MLRQVALRGRSENELQDVAREHGVKLSDVDRRSFNRTGMSLLSDILRSAERKIILNAISGTFNAQVR